MIKKRIAIVAHGLSNGGAERVAALLANQLYKRGYEVLFIAAYSDEKVYGLSDGVKYRYIEARSNKLQRFVLRTKEIDQAVESFRSDCVVSFIFKETLLTSFKEKVPIIYSLRIDPAIATEKIWNRYICNFTYNRAKAIVFQTPKARDFFNKKIQRKGVVIGNPLTPDLPYWDEGNHEKKIITACRLTPQKNLPMLIRGFAEFSKNHPDYTLWIYGDGPLKNSLIELAASLGVEDKVFLPGYAKDIHQIMANSAIFALTSDFEGLSNSMLEALAIGIPTICTDCPPGGAALYIRDHTNGLLIPVGDQHSLSRGLEELANDRTLQERISRNAVLIRDQLEEGHIVSCWEKVINGVLSAEGFNDG